MCHVYNTNVLFFTVVGKLAKLIFQVYVLLQAFGGIWPGQVDPEMRDSIGTTAAGRDFAKKWPKHYKKVAPDPEKSQSLVEAFSWPVKAKQNLARIVEALPADRHPVLLSNRRLSCTSNFSGVCSQTRAAMVLEAHKFGCQFAHLSFCEKTKQCQHRLVQDFPQSCIFTDQLHLLQTEGHEAMQKCKTFEESRGVLDKTFINSRSSCFRHSSLCKLPQNPDITWFGAPCVADSTMGKFDKDEGVSRRASSLTCWHRFLWKQYFSFPQHIGMDPDQFLSHLTLRGNIGSLAEHEEDH